MGLGLLGGAMSGAGEGIQRTGDMVGKMSLQEQAAEIQALRDERLQEFSRSERVAGQEFTGGQNALQRKSTEGIHAADRDLRASEGAAERGVRVSEGEANRGVDRERIEATRQYQNASLAIQRAAEGRLEKGSNIENDIKTIALGNAKRVQTLQTEFQTAAPDRKNAIKDEIQMLTGKDTDKFIPVPDGFDPITGKPNGYKIFDTKAGRFVDQEQKAPYADGTELKGKDGKTYVVRGGQPVLKEAKEKDPAKPGQKTSGKIGYAEALDKSSAPRQPKKVEDIDEEDRMPVP